MRAKETHDESEAHLQLAGPYSAGVTYDFGVVVLGTGALLYSGVVVDEAGQGVAHALVQCEERGETIQADSLGRFQRRGIAREASLGAEAPAVESQRLHLLIAELSGDPALALFTRIVMQLSEAHADFAQRSSEQRQRVLRNIRRLHAAIADAILARDEDAAVEALHRYFEGYRRWMQAGAQRR